jgi:ubiquinone/menaquinone biosynthesis C-methylase UbiE
MELANLAGNRFLPERGTNRGLQVGGTWTALLYDVAMRVIDVAGIRTARDRIAGGASGDVLEIGVGTGLNLPAYPASASLHGIDPSEPALAVASRRAGRLGRPAILVQGDAAALPYPDRSFDVVVGTFGATLAEARRVLRDGGTVRLLEHARSSSSVIARLQSRLAPSWSRASGGCRLDHEVGAAVRKAGLRVMEERSRGNGLLVEIVAAA